MVGGGDVQRCAANKAQEEDDQQQENIDASFGQMIRKKIYTRFCED